MTPEEYTAKFEKAAAEMLPMLERDVAKIGEFTKKLVQDVVLGHTHPGWAPLSSKTIARKAGTGHENEPLVRTGHLRESIHIEHGPLTVMVIASAPGAAAAEFGTSREPPRPFMRLAAEEALVYAIKRLKATAIEPFVGYGYRE